MPDKLWGKGEDSSQTIRFRQTKFIKNTRNKWIDRILRFEQVTSGVAVDFKDNLPEKYHALLDEYQNIFFKEEKFFEFVEILKLSESFIGFSGSPLNSA